MPNNGCSAVVRDACWPAGSSFASPSLAYQPRINADQRYARRRRRRRRRRLSKDASCKNKRTGSLGMSRDSVLYRSLAYIDTNLCPPQAVLCICHIYIHQSLRPYPFSSFASLFLPLRLSLSLSFSLILNRFFLPPVLCFPPPRLSFHLESRSSPTTPPLTSSCPHICFLPPSFLFSFHLSLSLSLSLSSSLTDSWHAYTHTGSECMCHTRCVSSSVPFGPRERERGRWIGRFAHKPIEEYVLCIHKRRVGWTELSLCVYRIIERYDTLPEVHQIVAVVIENQRSRKIHCTSPPAQKRIRLPILNPLQPHPLAWL